MQLLAGWRNDGYTWDQVELWSVGIPGGEGYEASYAPGNTEAMFVEDASMAAELALDAFNRTLVILDRQGNIVHKVSTDAMPLEDPGNRSQVDAWVRALLP